MLETLTNQDLDINKILERYIPNENDRAWAVHTIKGTICAELYAIPGPNILKGTTEKTPFNRYQAKDGNWYNGFMCSQDHLDGLNAELRGKLRLDALNNQDSTLK